MKNPLVRAKLARQAAWAACLGIALFAAPAWPRGGLQRPGGGHPAPAHAAPQRQDRPARQQGAMAPASGANRAPGAQPNRMQTVPGGRPAYNGSYSMRATPLPGHLPGWMAQHQNMPVGQQERLLRAEPGFNRLNPGEQQREIQQLHRLNELPDAQRQRRMARNEAIERLSPGERMQINQAARDWRTLPPERQQMLHGAFRDLRGVPVDQRETMLNSARYASAFTPPERRILSNLLRVEPYEPQR